MDNKFQLRFNENRKTKNLYTNTSFNLCTHKHKHTNKQTYNHTFTHLPNQSNSVHSLKYLALLVH